MKAVKVKYWVKNLDCRSVNLQGEYWLGIPDWRTVDVEAKFQKIILIAHDIPCDILVPVDLGALLQV